MQPEYPLWTVARFPDGSWTTGGLPTDPAYAGCEVYRVHASDRTKAKRKAQAQRARDAREMSGTRKLLDGRTVPELKRPVKVCLDTRCPSKWEFLDRETGETWMHDGTAFRRKDTKP